MPTYEYKCPLCEGTTSVVRSIHDDDPGYECANCKVKMNQMIGGGISIKFNGNGWGHQS